MTRRCKPSVLALAACLAGCGVSPEAGFVAAQPATDPVKPETPFTHALACLDNLLRVQPGPTRGGRRQMLTVGLIPDATGRINPGLRDMVSNAVLGGTHQSRRFTLIEAAGTPGLGGLPPGQQTVTVGGIMLGPSGGNQPLSSAGNIQSSFQILGSLTQADKAVQETGANAGLSVNSDTVGAGATSDFGAVVLDLRLVDVTTGTVLAATSNGLVIVNKGRSANAAIKLGSFGLSFDFSVDRREGPHQAIRTLAELSVVELLGDIAQVPYQECLSADRPGPAVMEQARTWFESKSPEERDAYVRQRLSALGYGVPDPPASALEAIRAYQVRNGLVPTGRAGFETFAKLAAAALPAASAGAPMPSAPPQPGGPRTLALTVRESAADHSLWLEARPDRAGYLSCFYRDEHGRTVRLYPNPHQPTVRVRGDLPVAIPPAGVPPFVIKPDASTAGTGFLCLQSGSDPTPSLPPAYAATRFQQLPAAGFEDIVADYRRAVPDDLVSASTVRSDNSWSRF